MSTTPYPLLEPTHGEGPFARLRVRQADQVLRLAWPTVLAMMSHTLMWTVDAIFLGHVSSVALGAAGLGGILTWTAYSLANNLSRISGTFVAQAHGSGDDDAIGDYTWQGLYVAIVAGILLQVFGYFSYLLLPLTHNPPEVLAQTYVFVKWRSASATLTQVSFCLTGFFQGRRKVMAPMWAGIAGNVVNVVLDLWLIFGWQGFDGGGPDLAGRAAPGRQGRGHRHQHRRRGAGAGRWPVPPSGRPNIDGVSASTVRAGSTARRSAALRASAAPAAWENFVDMSGFLVFTDRGGHHRRHRPGGQPDRPAAHLLRLHAHLGHHHRRLGAGGQLDRRGPAGPGGGLRAAGLQGGRLLRASAWRWSMIALRHHLFAIFTDDLAVPPARRRSSSCCWRRSRSATACG